VGRICDTGRAFVANVQGGPRGLVLVRDGTTLYQWDSHGAEFPVSIVDFGALGLRCVRRLAVSPSGDRLVLVATHFLDSLRTLGAITRCTSAVGARRGAGVSRPPGTPARCRLEPGCWYGDQCISQHPDGHLIQLVSSSGFQRHRTVPGTSSSAG
jgi:hypothetical protein